MSFVAIAGVIADGAIALGASEAVAGTVGAIGSGAIGGAGMGAAESALTGGNVGKGALFGALGGGITGGLGSAFGGGAGAAASDTAELSAAKDAINAPISAAGTTPISADPEASFFTNTQGGIGGVPDSYYSNAPGSIGGQSNTLDMGNVLNTSATTPTPSPTTAPQDPSAAAKAAIQNSFFGQHPLMTVGAGSLLGGAIGSKLSPTSATPASVAAQNQWNPWGNYYRFNPGIFQASQPTYIGRSYAEGGITDLNQTNPDPSMMASGNSKLDFMGQDAFPMSQQKLNFYNTPSQMPTSAQQAAASYAPMTNPLTGEPLAHFASGGISDLGGYSDGGRLTRGPGDGMSDDIPANIAGKQQARLAQGEFVVPADVVSHLGNGSTDAGAKQLYSMMDRVRKARTGRKSQGKQINARNQMPV